MDQDLHLGRPMHRGALSLFPVWNGRAVSSRSYTLSGDGVTVVERDGAGEVGSLGLSNVGTVPVLLLEGELLEGGRQDRVVHRSALVAPGETRGVDVRCVEQGRWDDREAAHVRRGRRAPLSIRCAGGQEATWSRISRLEQRHGPSPTASLTVTCRRLDAGRRIGLGGVRPLPFQAGVLIGIGGRPVLLEVFDSPRTLAEAWDDLLEAVSVDAIGGTPLPTPGWSARSFIESINRLNPRTEDVPMGQRVRARAGGLRLRSLVWDGRAIHTVAVDQRAVAVTA